MKLLGAIALIVVADFLAYIQVYGHTLWKLSKYQTILIVLAGIPISYLYMMGGKFSVESLETHWGSRILFLLLGNLVFTLCASYFAGEQFTLKNGVLLSLTLLILIVQAIWK